MKIGVIRLLLSMNQLFLELNTCGALGISYALDNMFSPLVTLLGNPG